MKSSNENEKGKNDLTDDELLEQFAQLIIDIYFDQQHEKEKHHPESST